MKYFTYVLASLVLVFIFSVPKAHAVWSYSDYLIAYDVVTGPIGVTDPSVSLVANPTSVSSGGSSTLTITAADFSSTPTCSIDQGVGAVAVSAVDATHWSGSKSSGVINSTTTFTATCTQGAETANGSAIVTVAAAGLDVTLSASPNPVSSSGQSTTLTWTVSSVGKVASCTASNGWSGSKATSGGSQSSGPITGPTTFTISCSGISGSDVDSVVVTVNTPPIVNGMCAATHYSCTSGSSINNTEDANAWMWDCAGSGGGSTASCSELKSGGGPVTACNDGIDNDTPLDGKIDMLDPGCSSPTDTDEANAKPIFIEF